MRRATRHIHTFVLLLIAAGALALAAPQQAQAGFFAEYCNPGSHPTGVDLGHGTNNAPYINVWFACHENGAYTFNQQYTTQYPMPYDVYSTYFYRPSTNLTGFGVDYSAGYARSVQRLVGIYGDQGNPGGRIAYRGWGSPAYGNYLHDFGIRGFRGETWEWDTVGLGCGGVDCYVQHYIQCKWNPCTQVYGYPWPHVDIGHGYIFWDDYGAPWQDYHQNESTIDDPQGGVNGARWSHGNVRFHTSSHDDTSGVRTNTHLYPYTSNTYDWWGACSRTSNNMAGHQQPCPKYWNGHYSDINLRSALGEGSGRWYQSYTYDVAGNLGRSTNSLPWGTEGDGQWEINVDETVPWGIVLDQSPNSSYVRADQTNHPVSFTDNLSGVRAFRVDRSVNGGAWTELGGENLICGWKNSCEFTYGGVPEGASVQPRIRVYDNSYNPAGVQDHLYTSNGATNTYDNTRPSVSALALPQKPRATSNWVAATGAPTATATDATSGLYDGTVHYQNVTADWTQRTCTAAGSALSGCATVPVSSMADGSTVNLRAFVADNAGTSPSVGDATSATGLTAHYKLDDPYATSRGMADSSGNNANGSTTGIIEWKTGSSSLGASVMFDESKYNGNQLMVPDGTNVSPFGAPGFSVEGWFYNNGFAYGDGWNTVFAKGSCTASGCNDAPAMFLNSNGALYTNFMLDGTMYSCNTATGTVANSAWYHFAVTHGDGFVRIYLNGSQVHSCALGGTINSNADAFSIGRRSGGNAVSWHTFHGHFEDFSVYRKTLSGARVAAHYAARTNATTYAASVMTDAPSAYYKLDEGQLQDSSGFNRHGIINSDMALGQAPAAAVPGTAASNSATFGSMQLAPEVTTLATSGFTLSGWVYWNGGGGCQRVFDFGVNTSNAFLFSPNCQAGNASLYTVTSSPSRPGAWLDVGRPLPTGRWVHLAVTLNGSLATIYLDGTQVAQTPNTTLPSQLGASGLTNYLGKSHWVADPSFQGSLDDIQTYSRALSAREIEDDYQVGRNPAAMATSAWRVDTTSPADLTDLAPGQPITAAWRNTAATVRLRGSDATSGLQVMDYQLDGGAVTQNVAPDSTVTVSANGSHTLLTRAVDNAGNETAWSSNTINIDTLAPSDDTPVDAGNWHQSAQTIAVTCTDPVPGSGLDATSAHWRINAGTDLSGPSASTVTLASDGVTTLETRCVDAVGNTSAWKSQTIRIDLNDPTDRTKLDPVVPNGSFETGLGGWNTWVSTVATSPVAKFGAASARLTSTGTNPHLFNDGATRAVSPSVSYTVSAYVKRDGATPARDGQAGIRFFGAGGEFTQSYCGQAALTNAASPGTWTRLTCTITAPAWANRAAASVIINSSLSGDTFLIDGVQIDEGASATEFGRHADQTTWQDANVAITATGTDAAQQARNASWESALSNWTAYTGFPADTNVTVDTLTSATGPLGAQHGDSYLRVRRDAGATHVGVMQSRATAGVLAGRTYTMSVHAAAPAGASRTLALYADWNLPGSVYDSQSQTFTVPGDLTWRRYDFTFTVPSDATNGSVFAWLQSASAGQTLYLDAFQVEEGLFPTPFSNATPGLNSAIANMQYRPLAGAWTNVANDATFTVSTEGTTTWQTRAVDNSGRVSALRTHVVKLDKTNPTAVVADPAPTSTYLRASAFTPRAVIDDTVSGLADGYIEERVDAGSWTRLAGCVLTPRNTVTADVVCAPRPTSTLSDGAAYRLRAVGVDNVGRRGTSTETLNTVDRTKPTDTVTDPTPSSPWVRGTHTPSGTFTDATSGPDRGLMQERANTNPWSDLAGCSNTGASVTCAAHNTTVHADGTVEELRLRDNDSARNDAYSRLVLDENPVGYWGIDESSGTVAADDGSASTDGAYRSGVTLGAPGAPVTGNRRAAGLDGTNDDILIPDAAELRLPSAFTVEMWARGTGTSRTLARKGGNFTLRFTSGGTLQFYTVRASDAVQVSTSTAGTLNDGNWHHVAGTYDGATMRLYVDGAQADSFPHTGARQTAGALSIGSSGSGEYLPGAVDEVAVYPQALSAAQIAAHYAAASPSVANTVDNTPPVLTVTGNPGSAWQTAPVTLSFSATDALSGVASIQHRVNAGAPTTFPGAATTRAFTTDGVHNWEAWANDNATNSSAVAAGTLRIDTTAPALTLTCPDYPAWKNTTVTCTVTASDATSALASTEYRVESSPGSGSYGAWTAMPAAGGTFTYTTQGSSLVQARSTDNAGLSTTATTSARYDSVPPTGTMSNPGNNLRRNVTLSGSAADATPGSGVASVTFQIAPTGTGSWSTACTDTTSPYSCVWDSTTVPDGDYDFRELILDNATNQTTSNVIVNRRIDNSIPTATIAGTTTGAYDSGLITITSVAVDPPPQPTGISLVSLQYRSPAGSGAWLTAPAPCATLTPAGPADTYTCELDSTDLPDGTVDLRIRAVDGAGNEGFSPVLSPVLDNTPPAVTLQDPTVVAPSYIKGAVTLRANATDAGSGVASVRIERAATGTGAWVTVCTDTTAAAGDEYSCELDTTVFAHGERLDFRAVAVDNRANTATSAQRNDRMVDNTPPTETVDGYDPAWTNQDVTLTLWGTDGPGSGMGTATWRINAGAEQSQGSQATFTLSASGVHTVETRVSDRALNASPAAPAWTARTVRIDKNAPTATITGVPATWSRTPVTFTVNGADEPGGSGIADGRWRVDLGAAQGAEQTGVLPGTDTISTEGVHTIRAWARDIATNESAEANATARIDWTPPTDTTDAPDGWQSGDTVVNVTGTDPLSGVEHVEYRINGGPIVQGATGQTSVPVTITDEGTTTLQTRIFDEAGNETGWKTQTVRIDLTDPTIVVLDGAGNPYDGSGWKNTDVTVLLRGSDQASLSRVASIQWETTDGSGFTDIPDTSAPNSADAEPFEHTLTFTEEGARTLRARTFDHAGRASAWETFEVRLDKTAPDVNATAFADPAARIEDSVVLMGIGADVALRNAPNGSGLAAGHFEFCSGETCTQPGAGNWNLIDQSSVADVPDPRCAPTMSPTGGEYECNFDTRLVENGTYYVRIVAADNAGNIGRSAPLDAVRFRNGTTCPVRLRPIA